MGIRYTIVYLVYFHMFLIYCLVMKECDVSCSYNAVYLLTKYRSLCVTHPDLSRNILAADSIV